MKENIVSLLILYEHIYDKLYEVAGRSKEITWGNSKKLVAHSFNIPYQLWTCVLKVMEDLDWIEKENKHLIRVKRKPSNVLININKYYAQLNLF